MRERRLVLEGSFCENNLYADGPQTHADAVKSGRQQCPKFGECDNGGLNPDTGFQCIMAFGLEVAQHTLKGRTNIQGEIADFRRANLHPKKGWMYSPDRKEFSLITDDEKAIELIEYFAHIALNDADPTAHQDPRLAIGSDFNSVVAHAMTPDGIDLGKMQELEGRFGTNGGRGCDVLSGPCSCGAWH